MLGFYTLKEHIANKEQTVYDAITVNFRGVLARILGHKEREMSPAALRVVEGSAPMEKSKALDAALSQIERAFGKGSRR